MTQSRSVRHFVIAGTVQLASPSAPAPSGPMSSSIARSGDVWECRTPELQVSWDAEHASHAAGDGSLCVVWGSPRSGSSLPNGIAGRATARQVLDALSVSGAAALCGIRGGYGVFYFDRDRQQSLVAVDRFAIETACYAAHAGGMSFSDQADAVQLPSRQLQAQSLYDYLYFHCIGAPSTVFDGVRRLSHGGYLRFDRHGLAEGRHWTPQVTASRATSLEALSQEFRDLLRTLIADEANRGERLGCFLSGGTDSSTIAGMLCAVTGTKAPTYSIGFHATGYDEMEYARIAARHFGTEHHEIYLTADDLVALVPQIASFLDQPFGNSSVAPALLCTRTARADGVTRMLAGDGGDELFGGNSRYSLQQFLERYSRLPALLRTRLIEPALTTSDAVRRVPGLKQAAGYVRYARQPMPERMESFNLLSRIGADRIFDPELLRAFDGTAPLRVQREVYAQSLATNVIDRMLQYDWKFTLADSDLPKVRTAIGLAGLTVGYPLLADELVDFSLRLPPHYKVRNFSLRWFFKHALRDFLPKAILRKKKHGFGLPFGPWVVEHAGLRDLAADSLKSLEGRGILRAGFRDELLRDLLPAHPGYYGELVWILMMLEQWLHAHPECTDGIPTLPTGAGSSRSRASEPARLAAHHLAGS